jgi:hypothetical protein
MLITENVEVIIGGRNYNHYKKLGYDVAFNTPIFVSIDDLTLGSHVKVEVQCDYCGEKCWKVYKAFLKERQISIVKKDCCKNCIYTKDSETNMFLYGVENSFNRPDVWNKMKNTILNIFGVENISQNLDIKEKVKNTRNNFSEEKRQEIREKTSNTNLERYGETSYTKTNEYLEKTKRTSLIKYGTENPNQSEIVKNKSRKTCLEKYGVDNYFASNVFKEYIKNYWMELEGVNHYSKTQDFKNKITEYWENITPEDLKDRLEKSKATCFSKYGLEYVLQLPLIRKSLYDKMGLPTSGQQEKILSLISSNYSNVYGNVKLSPYLLDILIFENNVNLVIEYDCWYWHSPEVDDRKNNFLFDSRYKLLRIKSGKLIPNIDNLFYEINNLLYSDNFYSEIILKDWNEEKYQKGRIKK